MAVIFIIQKEISLQPEQQAVEGAPFAVPVACPVFNGVDEQRRMGFQIWGGQGLLNGIQSQLLQLRQRFLREGGFRDGNGLRSSGGSGLRRSGGLAGGQRI